MFIICKRILVNGIWSDWTFRREDDDALTAACLLRDFVVQAPKTHEYKLTFHPITETEESSPE